MLVHRVLRARGCWLLVGLRLLLMRRQRRLLRWPAHSVEIHRLSWRVRAPASSVEELFRQRQLSSIRPVLLFLLGHLLLQQSCILAFLLRLPPFSAMLVLSIAEDRIFLVDLAALKSLNFLPSVGSDG